MPVQKLKAAVVRALTRSRHAVEAAKILEISTNLQIQGGGVVNEQARIMDWILAGTPAPAPHAVKMEMVKRFIDQSGSNLFIETGTYEGETTEKIAETGVKVITIELSPELHTLAAKKFATQSNVKCLQGNSSDIFPDILKICDEPAVFWLDGHYSEGKTARGSRDTPLVEELFHIFMHQVKNHIILIDDVRLFDGIEYPSIAWIAEFVRLYMPDSKMDVLHDIVRIRPNDFPI